MPNDQQNRGVAPIGPPEIKEAVGSLILIWSKVETDLSKAVDEMGANTGLKKPHGITRTLDRWKSLHDEVGRERPDHQEVVDVLFIQLSDALRIRNGVSHGHIGTTYSQDGDPEAANISFELNGETATIDYATLLDCVVHLARSRTHIGRLTSAWQHPDKLGMKGLYEDVLMSMRKPRRI